MNYMAAYVINEVAEVAHDSYDGLGVGGLDLVLEDVIGENRVSKRDSHTCPLFYFQCEVLFNTWDFDLC